MAFLDSLRWPVCVGALLDGSVNSIPMRSRAIAHLVLAQVHGSHLSAGH